jgi:uncharacterized membrane protein
MAKNLSANQFIGLCILIALALLYVPIPFIQGTAIASLIMLIAGAYLLIKG